MQTTNIREGDVSSASADLGLRCNQRSGTFEFFSDRVRRFRAIEAPPLFGGANLRLRKLIDLDVKRPAHSRLRSSARKSDSGVVSPR